MSEEMSEAHRRFHITTRTVEKAAEIEKQARQAVLQIMVDHIQAHGMTAPVASGVLAGWFAIAHLDMERFQIAAELRRMADAIDATTPKGQG